MACARSFLVMIGMFIIANGFAFGLLYPTHLHLTGDTCTTSVSGHATSEDGEDTTCMWSITQPTAVSDTCTSHYVEEEQFDATETVPDLTDMLLNMEKLMIAQSDQIDEKLEAILRKLESHPPPLMR